MRLMIIFTLKICVFTSFMKIFKEFNWNIGKNVNDNLHLLNKLAHGLLNRRSLFAVSHFLINKMRQVSSLFDKSHLNKMRQVLS